MKEAIKVLNEINNSMKALSQKSFSQSKTNKSTQNTNIVPFSSGSTRQDKVNGGPQPGTSFHVAAQYTYYGNVFTSCESITSYLSGMTFDVSWSQTDSTYNIIDSGRTLATTVYGTLTSYLVTPIGLVAVNSEPESVYTEFYV